MPEFDLIIIGGGLAGASLAVALRDSRLKIALIETQAPQRPSGWDARIYALSPANARFLARIGTWQHLDNSRMAAIRQMVIAGDAGGQLDFSAYDVGVPELGWILESSLMAHEFWESLKRQSNVQRFCPARPQHLGFTTDHAQLTLADGQTLSARLVVAADGRDSWTRTQAGLSAIDHPYDEKGLVANFTCAKPHRGIAYQWFRDDGVLAYLPLPGNRISIVWSTPDAHADALCALSPDTLADRVAEAGHYTLGGLQPLTPAAAFPLRLIRVPQTVSHRLALVGDAAHGIHPLSGHGINLGFQDAAVLAEQLASAHPWQDIGEARFLRRYQRARREETVLMQNTTDALRRLFRQNTPGIATLRNLGLNLTQGLSPLKNALVRYALGNL